ncbi:MAG: hypothetical protein SF066_03960, partial [Thermoanaerobaculia bacterium]|nr:hypothetical protein [Thermoanaerobaculia bacterium]
MPKNLGKLACLGLLAGLVTLSGCRSDEFGRAYATERRAALQAKSGVRFTPGRLVDVPWSPVHEPPQGQVANPAVPAGPAQFRGEGVAVYTPLESASRGFALLVDRGEGQSADSVLRRFEQAWEAGQRDPAFLNDYAAALLERGLPRDLILGGEYAARALEAAELDDPAGDLAQAARFNWALAIKRLALHGQAIKAWQAVLDHETDSHWRAEAEAHLEDLARWPVARWPQVRQEVRAAAARGDGETVARLLPDFRTAVRLLGEDEELKTWAETLETDPPRATEALTVARTIGAALA